MGEITATILQVHQVSILELVNMSLETWKVSTFCAKLLEFSAQAAALRVTASEDKVTLICPFQIFTHSPAS
jgi:hypothetical protein